MAEQAAVGSWMIVRQRHCVCAMTFAAVRFRLFFIHFQQLTVLVIVRQVRSRLWRRIPENKKNAAADRDKEQIVEQNAFLWFFRHEQSRMVWSGGHFQGMKTEQPDAEEEDEQLHQEQGAGRVADSKTDDSEVLLLAAQQGGQSAVMAVRVKNPAGRSLPGNHCRIHAFPGQTRGQPGSIADQPRCPELMSLIIVVDQGGLAGLFFQLPEAFFFGPANQTAFQASG